MVLEDGLIWFEDKPMFDNLDKLEAYICEHQLITKALEDLKEKNTGVVDVPTDYNLGFGYSLKLSVQKIEEGYIAFAMGYNELDETEQFYFARFDDIF
jgi:hypothetical protein